MAKKVKAKRVDAAYKEAVAELNKDRVNEVKVMLKATLEAIFERQKKRSDLDKEIRFLQDDIKDLKAGKLDRIKKRREADSQLAKVGKLDVPKLEQWQTPLNYYYSDLAQPIGTTIGAAWTTSTNDIAIDANSVSMKDLVSRAMQ